MKKKEKENLKHVFPVDCTYCGNTIGFIHNIQPVKIMYQTKYHNPHINRIIKHRTNEFITFFYPTCAANYLNKDE